LALVLWALRKWAGLGDAALVAVVMAWIVKDAILYPLTWKAYTPRPGQLDHPMAGARGTALTDLSPGGRVRMGPETWNARAVPETGVIPAGAPIRVREASGLTLMVEPDGEWPFP
ncbi:MAG: NfeD family protein, partial [Pseudomonadota bacterium]